MLIEDLSPGNNSYNAQTLVQHMLLEHPKGITNHKETKFNRDGSLAIDGPHHKKNYEIYKVTFKNVVFGGDFHDLEFTKCNFISCKYIGVYGFYLMYTKCKFYDCYIFNSTFSHIELIWEEVYFIKCRFRNVEIDEAGFFNIFFNDCHISALTVDGVYPIDNMCFDKCTIEGSQFKYINWPIDEAREREDEDYWEIHFDDCSISDTVFNTFDLRYSLFWNTVLYKCCFIECKLGEDTIDLSEEPKNVCYASLDFQTILKSDPIPEYILKIYFNIPEDHNMKEIVKSITSEINFSTVFFSYSFKDSAFVSRLNDALVDNGIRTFMWQKNAPGGKSLQEIMASGIHKNDRVLFVSSESSIKSTACQFEISTARQKQEKEWKTILFPIHIDRFLFEVEKRDIRPIALMDEYWKNIEELRLVNSLDFSDFVQPDANHETFNSMVLKLVESLRIDEEK